MKKTNLIGAMLFAMLTPQLLPAQQQITLHDADGKAFNVLLRKALPVNAPRVRYPGFKQETFILKAGSIRREGTMPLPCDILLERDVPVKMRDGVTIYADVFRPVTAKVVQPSLPGTPTEKR